MWKFRWSGFFWWILVWFWFFMLSLFYGLFWYILIEDPNNVDENTIDEFSLEHTQKAMEEVYGIIKTQYYNSGSIDEVKMSRQAISSFVNGLGDPFSSYLPPDKAQQFQNDIKGDGSIDGIGAVLSQTDRGVMIEEVIHSSPAAQAGLRPLDIIVKINGTGVQNQNVHEVVQQIRGPKGTIVDLTLTRISEDGSLEIIEKTITRDTIVIPSVSSKILTGYQNQTIWYIWLSVFAEDTDSRLKKEIEKLLQQNIQWIILDVRGNGWGLLEESVSVVSHFLKQDSIVTQAQYSIYQDDQYKAEWWDMLSHLPLVVLVNWYSASASEIIALALRENRCPSSVDLSIAETWSWSVLSPDCTTILLGSRTFWKWTIQSVQNLTFGGSLKLTVWKWFSPSNISVHEVGILPDYLVELDPETYYESGTDAQLEKAISLLSQYLNLSRY